MASIKELLQSMINKINGKNEGVDWNENDETSPAFVKNRTHYVTNEIIPEQTVTVSMIRDGLYVAKIIDIRSDFEEGKQYTVWWNSTQYECIATDMGVGNRYFNTGNEEENTGEPFLILDGMVATDSDGEKTIKAIADTSVYVPIDIRFIPDGIPHSKLKNGHFAVNIGSISGVLSTNDHYTELEEALESGDLSTISIRGKRESVEGIYNYYLRVDQNSYIINGSTPNPSGGGYIDYIEIHAKYEIAYWFVGDDHAIICNNTYGPRNNDKMLYLKSSTEGSKKQFRITVDDSGTISATEVT